MPPQGIPLIPMDEILRYEEILRIVRGCVRLGVRKFRITGGEPLVRKGAVGLVSALARIRGVDDLCMTTNGVLLVSHAKELKEAGLHRATVSLDSLRSERYERITGSDCLHNVIQGVEAALTEGLTPVKINVVVIQGVNDDEVADFARLTLSLPLEVRFIERMPFGGIHMGGTGCGDSMGPGLSGDEVVRRIERAVGPLERAEPMLPVPGPARLYRLPRAAGCVGVISAVTAPFCSSCTRVRLTPEGGLRQCLFLEDSMDLKALLRSGISDEGLVEALRDALARKPLADTLPAEGVRRSMCQIGG
jgi:GTP 3',8-cyclase